MNEKSPIHLLGRVYWLPSHHPERPSFYPGVNFRAYGKITTDFDLSYTVLINYSPQTDDQGFNKVRVNIPIASQEDISRITRHSEIIILEGPRVVAVCRNLYPPRESDGKMGDRWD
jgi:hypothetical protein